MTPATWLVAYCGVIAAASLLGGWLPTRVRLTHTRMQLMMSFVAGLMLGVALLHMLPHAAQELGSLDKAVLGTLAGLLGMFFLIRTFHFHQHGSEEELAADDEADEADEQGREAPEGAVAGKTCDHVHHDHDHDHAHDHDHDHHSAHGAKRHAHGGHGHSHGEEVNPAELLRSGSAYGWLGLALGLGVHTLIDGLALGASVVAESHGGREGWLFGVGTFLAVVLHKPLDAMSITTLMRTAGWSLQRQQVVNVVFALLCPFGALGFWFGMSTYLDSHHYWLGIALACSAGVFLCISLGDLLPEVHFHTHDRLKLSIALLAGVLLAYAVGLLEPTHAHGPAERSPAPSHRQTP